jgi:hypothetical protein
VKENIKPVQTTDLVSVVRHVVDCRSRWRATRVTISINLSTEPLLFRATRMNSFAFSRI